MSKNYSIRTYVPSGISGLLRFSLPALYLILQGYSAVTNLHQHKTANDSEGVITSQDVSSTPTREIANELPKSVLHKIEEGNNVHRVPSSGRLAEAPTSNNKRSGVGGNLSQIVYWNSMLPFINQLKAGRPWITSCDLKDTQCANFSNGAVHFETKEQAHLDLDDQGYVKYLPDIDNSQVKYRYIQTILFQGNGGAHAAGRYIVLYDGEGEITYSLGGKKNVSLSRPGRDVVDIVNTPKDIGTWIAIRRVKPGNHIRNIRIIPPGGVCIANQLAYVKSAADCEKNEFRSLEMLLAVGKIFHPSFLADMQHLRAIRFMDWMRANQSNLRNWADRPKLSDAFWSSDDGVPVEVMLQLTAETNTDPWFVLPVEATDGYVKAFAEMINKMIDAERNIYLEYGNEPWNYSGNFGVQGMKHEERARLKWGNLASAFDLRLEGYAWQAARFCEIFKSIIRNGTKVNCVLNSQAFRIGVSSRLLECPIAAKELGKPCHKIFDSLAIAPYFGHYIATSETMAIISKWPSEPDGGLSTLFSEIFGTDQKGVSTTSPLNAGGSKTPAGGSLAASQKAMIDSIRLAAKYGVTTVAYEGGQHVVLPFDNPPKPLLEMLYYANHDDRMADAYRRNLNNWVSAGGQLFMQFEYASVWSKYGNWGMKEGLFSIGKNPKWEAVKNFNATQSCWWQGC
jgi:hypothetical protein